MKKIVAGAFFPAAFALSACSSSDSAKEQAQPDNVEMPAEEAVGDVAGGATPVADPSALPGVEVVASDAASATAAPKAE